MHRPPQKQSTRATHFAMNELILDNDKSNATIEHCSSTNHRQIE